MIRGAEKAGAGAKYTRAGEPRNAPRGASLSTLDVGGVEIPWWGSPGFARGDSEPVVLLAGLGWRATGCALAGWLGDRPIVAFDSPRRWPREPLDSTAALARVYAGALDALGCRRVRLAGVSLGGMVATALALERPDLVASLALVSTAATGSRIAGPLRVPASRAVAALLGDEAFYGLYRQWGPALVGTRTYREPTEAARFWTDPMSRRKMADLLRASRRHDARARLSEIAAPAIVVHGAADALFPVTAGEELAHAIAGARLVRIGSAGHFAFLTHQARVVEELETFWKGGPSHAGEA